MSTCTPSARTRTTSSTSAFQQSDKAKVQALPTADASHAPAAAEAEEGSGGRKAFGRDHAADLGDHRPPDEGRGQGRKSRQRPRQRRRRRPRPQPSGARRRGAPGKSPRTGRGIGRSPRRPRTSRRMRRKPQGQPSLRLRSLRRKRCLRRRRKLPKPSAPAAEAPKSADAPPKMASTRRRPIKPSRR